MALVRDPAFWRRFSRAIHLDAEARSPDTEHPRMFSYVSPCRGTEDDLRYRHANNPIHRDDWIKGQHRKKRRGVICCVAISVATIVVVVAVIVVLWWFGTHDWKM